MTITIRINRWTLLVASTLLLLALTALVTPWHTNAAPAPTPTPKAACPQLSEPRITEASVLRLEHGYMVWIGDKRLMYVMVYDPGSTTQGTFKIYPETWEEGMPETDPSIKPPPNLWQPTRGMGLVWRTQSGVRDQLGYGLSGDTGYMAVITVQGKKTWFNGIDDAFKIEGDKWEELYAWRK